MTELAAKSAIKEATKAFLSRTELIWGNVIDRAVEYFYDGVQGYLERQQEKFLWTKTFLHRDPVYFYDIFFPLRIKSKTREITVSHYTDFFGDEQCLAIIGAAGSGKSTTMRHLFLNVIQKGEDEIPLFIELRRLTETGDLGAYLEKHALGDGLVLTTTQVARLLDAGSLILFLDGFDEVAGECYSSLVQSIDDLSRRYPKVRFVVTGRPGSRVETLRGFKCYQMEKLSAVEIKRFIERQNVGVEMESRVTQIVTKISKEKKKYLTEYLSNPLLLSLFILTCATTKQLPDRKSAFYKRVIDTLFVEHDSLSKPDYDRRLKSGLSQVKFEHLLQRFSAVSFFNSKVEFDLGYIHQQFSVIFSKSPELKADTAYVARDLVVGVGLWKEDGGEYSFSHRSLQEYFAAEFISGIETAKKEEVYKKLRARVREGGMTEVENFLSLCLEVDEQAYIRFFLLPILSEIINFIGDGTDGSKAVKLIRNHYSEVVIGFSRASKSVKRISAFNRVSWRYTENNELAELAAVYPGQVRDYMFQLLLGGLINGLIVAYGKHGIPERITSGSSSPTDKWQTLDIKNDITNDMLREIVDKHKKIETDATVFTDFIIAENGKWVKRLSELDHADSCLIADLL